MSFLSAVVCFVSALLAGAAACVVFQRLIPGSLTKRSVRANSLEIVSLAAGITAAQWLIQYWQLPPWQAACTVGLLAGTSIAFAQTVLRLVHL
ncbi:hypothetical protein V5738_00750 [Salinisphaera sp. SPP-AMP-43]|uniref:hypothetical protein n=1 Tax=Salinisphaera sp. SPP-AMP-43 TaxID=3121288 RepID=UPI003C6E8713